MKLMTINLDDGSDDELIEKQKARREKKQSHVKTRGAQRKRRVRIDISGRCQFGFGLVHHFC